MIWKYDFDTLWIWGYDFDMVLLYFWHGLAYGLDMLLIWFGNGVPFQGSQSVGFKKGNRKGRGQAFGWFLEGFSGFDMSLLLFLYGFDTIVKVNLCFPLLSQVEPKQLRNSHFLNCKLIGCKGDHMRKWKMS
jgi:hypothetical protein